MVADRKLNVQTPGASPTPSAGGDEAAATALPPDLQAVVQAEVAKALAKQAPAASGGKQAQPALRYDDAVTQQAALPREQRKPVLTDIGWYVPPGYGDAPPKASLG